MNVKSFISFLAEIILTLHQVGVKYDIIGLKIPDLPESKQKSVISDFLVANLLKRVANPDQLKQRKFVCINRLHFENMLNVLGKFLNVKINFKYNLDKMWTILGVPKSEVNVEIFYSGSALKQKTVRYSADLQGRINHKRKASYEPTPIPPVKKNRTEKLYDDIEKYNVSMEQKKNPIPM